VDLREHIATTWPDQQLSDPGESKLAEGLAAVVLASIDDHGLAMGTPAAAMVVDRPFVDAWEKAPGLLERLLAGVDVAYLDGTFYDGRELPDRPLDEIPHPLMTRTMDRLAELAKARPGALRFVHLNHTNPALHDAALRRQITARGFAIAAQGERVGL
jgi:pyrroloquinoline quinone biosynthesis protein B